MPHDKTSLYTDYIDQNSKRMGFGLKYLKMEIGTKVHGKMIKLIARENLGMLMEIIMKVFGKMIKLIA